MPQRTSYLNEGTGEESAAPGDFLTAVKDWHPESFQETVPCAMTCDVEDYFQVSAFSDIVPRAQWPDLECRVERNIDRILGLLDETGSKATFFTLGWIAERYPAAIRRLAEHGHEIASHGMVHQRIWEQKPEQFREDASVTRKLLEDITGTPVVGYRAASWSLDQRTPWAHDILADIGYRFSSSIYPVAHDHFGMPSAPRRPFYLANSGLLEIPASTMRLGGRNIPAGGGGYFRLYPLALSKWLIRKIHIAESPYVFYFHPWEIDPEQPRMKGASARTRFRHYLNLDKFESRWKSLLGEFQWDRMDAIYLREKDNDDE